MDMFLKILDALAALATIAGFVRDIRKEKQKRMTKGAKKEEGPAATEPL